MHSISSEGPTLDRSRFASQEGLEKSPSQTEPTPFLTTAAAPARLLPRYSTQTHWVADFVKCEAGRDVATCRAEIREFGFTRPVTRVQGEIIDGLDVLAACDAENTSPTFRDIETDRPAELLISLKVAGAYNEGQRACLVELLTDRKLAVKHGGSRSQEALVPLERMKDRAARARCAETTQKKAHKLVGYGDIEMVRKVIRGELTLNAALALPGSNDSKPKTDRHEQCKLEIESLRLKICQLKEEIARLRARLGADVEGSHGRSSVTFDSLSAYGE